ncbi:MAG: rod shape-determining protein MreD [Candidatus Omnitrophica bacterium]|nr:rod shape-determining protein MreD [Candidatus Omnitrophota bacterium]
MHRVSNATIFLLLICTGLIQATGFDYISLLGAKPDLLFIIVAFFALTCSRQESLKAAVIAGLIKDITSSSILGGYTVSFVLVALFLNHHQNKFFKEKFHTQILVTGLFYFLTCLLVLFVNSISDRAFIHYYPLMVIALKGAVYTGLVSPPVFFALSKSLRIRLAPGF